METVCLNDLKAISWIRKITVSGYIHTLESKHSQQIPEQIILLCMLFYGNDCDEWNVSFIGNGLESKDRTLSAIPISGIEKAGSAYGKRVIKSGRFSWRFRIESMDMMGRGNKPMVGIWRVNFIDNPPLDTFFTKGKEQGYGFAPLGPKLSSYNSGYTADEYGVVAEDGDTVTMIIDLDQLSLCWKINDKSYGKSHDIIKDTYRAAVYMANSEKIVEIVE